MKQGTHFMYNEKKDFTVYLISGLIIATRKDDVVAVSELLQLNCNPSAGEDRSGLTPLHHAVECASYKSASVLLTYGADPKKEDSSGISPIDIAIEKKDKQMIQIFETFDSRLHIRNICI
jgi:ankyrin repeat protein